MKVALLTVGALAVLTACAGSTPSHQEQELLDRKFTHITTDYNGRYTKKYTVTVGSCRVRIGWTMEHGWDKLEGLNTEVTANDILNHKDYQHCKSVPSSSNPSPTPSTGA